MQRSPGAMAAPAQTRTYALPALATEGQSTVMNVPGFMVLMDEGGTVPSDATATCDNQPDGNSSSSVGFHLEHYFADAKDIFDLKVGGQTLFQDMT